MFRQVEIFGLDSLEWETPTLRLSICPQMGAKIISLYHKPGDREWLVPPVGGRLELPGANRLFTACGLCGWDEMFPTIHSCRYPLNGQPSFTLPDHGEVWSLPWQVVEKNANGCTLSVQGKLLPYQLERKLEIHPHSARLIFRYHLQNLGEEPLNWMWAAHPQFHALAQTAIRLPEHVNEVINVRNGELFGLEGTRLNWPVAFVQRGETYRLDIVRPVETRQGRKVYIAPDVRVSSARLEDLNSGTWLEMRWQTCQLPYLGIWVDEGLFAARPVVALEPTNGYFDSLEFAYDLGRASCLPVGASANWDLEVEFGTS